jgi:pimeloyl-ACP methyl ester carboxylesterase
LLRQRAEHAVRPLPGGGFTWKYDRALRDAIRQGRLRLPADLWAAVARITCPTLLVRGSALRRAPEEMAKRMAEELPPRTAGGGAGRRPHRPRRSAGARSSRCSREFLMP